MEPAGFFLLSTMSLMGQLYFMRTSSDFSNTDFRTRLENWFRGPIYRRHGFDSAAYEALRRRVLGM